MGWGDLGDRRGGKHDPGHRDDTLFPVNLRNPGGGGSFQECVTLPSLRCPRTVFYRSSWMLSPPGSPLYPGASANYSSPPCCVSVCIGRMGSGRQIPRPGPVSPPRFLRSGQRPLSACPEPTLLWQLSYTDQGPPRGPRTPGPDKKKHNAMTDFDSSVSWQI